MDRIRVGNVEVVAVLDMLPPPYEQTEFFPGVLAEAWEGDIATHLEGGKLQLYYGCFALRAGGRVILVDTGKGPGPHADRANRRGDLLNDMRRQGLDPEEVDTVVHTHLHGDHVGWNITMVDGRPEPTFPKARHLISKGDWDYFRQPEVLEGSPQITSNVLPLEGLGALEIIDSDHTLTPEVSTIATKGHTPGHLNVVIASKGEKAAIVGDMLHSSVQVGEPGWCSRADVDAAQAEATRRAMLERFEQEGFVVAAGHFRPEWRFGSVVRLGERYQWHPL